MTHPDNRRPDWRNDWPTLVLAALCYLGFGLSTTTLAAFSLWIAVPVTAAFIALHASLQHEVLHGHPFRSRLFNALLVAPTLNLAVPYLRFVDTHLEHHKDAILTDPYDDPETNYIDPVLWDRAPLFLRLIYRANNTLAGRMALGPALGQIAFMARDAGLIRDRDRRVLLGWALHLPAVALVLWWVLSVSAMPLGSYLVAAYLGLSLLKLRTFLEHQAHDSARGRTVVIEDRGMFALLFLNNNFHVVHHMHPGVAWFRLPALFGANRAKYLKRNHGYYYTSYAQIIRKYLFRAKDPVAHPLWRGDQRQSPLPERAARRIRP